MKQPPEGSVWALVDAVSVLFMHAYTEARARAFAHASPMVRLLAARDHAHAEAVLLERELAIFRSQRRGRPAKTRPHYTPQERSEILHLMRLRGWSAKETAARFVVHPNTIRNWKRALRDKHRAESLIGAPPWNKLHAGVRWLVHEIRTLCPERDFGTRTIARHIMRAGIQISRASVRRILEEERPSRAPGSPNAIARPRTTAPEHFFHPPRPNHVWHMDLTTFRVLWMRCEVAAIIDGFSRKIVGLRAYRGTPTTVDLVELVDNALGEHSAPRFMITDHGGQFQTAFHAALAERRIKHVRGRVQSWQFNAKVERLFWSLKRWGRFAFLVPDGEAIQGSLDA